MEPMAAETLPAGFSIASPTVADAPAVLALMHADELAAFGETDSEIEDFIFDWEEADLARDGWLARADDGALAAYALVTSWSGGFDVQCVVRPELAGAGLREPLLSMAERRARERLAAAPATPPILRCYEFLAPGSGGDVLAAAGFRVETWHYRMQIDQTGPPAAAIWPAGCHLRTVRPGQDDAMLHQFVDTAFDWEGRTPWTFAEWRDFMMRADHFIPDLWFLLFCETTLVGCALCYDYEANGWVRQLAVAAEWRRHGVGSALMQHTFAEFYRRGKPRVALGVAAQNEKALRFYEQLGMRRVRQIAEHHKRLD